MSGVVVSDGLHSQFTQVELRVLKNKVIFMNRFFFFPFNQFSIWVPIICSGLVLILLACLRIGSLFSEIEDLKQACQIAFRFELICDICGRLMHLLSLRVVYIAEESEEG